MRLARDQVHLADQRVRVAERPRDGAQSLVEVLDHGAEIEATVVQFPSGENDARSQAGREGVEATLGFVETPLSRQDARGEKLHELLVLGRSRDRSFEFGDDLIVLTKREPQFTPREDVDRSMRRFVIRRTEEHRCGASGFAAIHGPSNMLGMIRAQVGTVHPVGRRERRLIHAGGQVGAEHPRRDPAIEGGGFIVMLEGIDDASGSFQRATRVREPVDAPQTLRFGEEALGLGGVAHAFDGAAPVRPPSRVSPGDVRPERNVSQRVGTSAAQQGLCSVPRSCRVRGNGVTARFDVDSKRRSG